MNGPSPEQVEQARECLAEFVGVEPVLAAQWAPELAQMWLDREAGLLPTPLGLH